MGHHTSEERDEQHVLPSSSPDRLPYSAPTFSPFVNAFATLLLLAGLFSLAEMFISSNANPLQWVDSPEHALALIANRTLDAEYAYSKVSRWEQQIYKLTNGGADHELNQVRRWYEELIADPDVDLMPRDWLYLAVLRAEAKDLPALQEILSTWKDHKAPYPFYTQVLKSAYLGSPDRQSLQTLQAKLYQEIPTGWFKDTLMLRLAARAGDGKQLAAAEKRLQTRSSRLLTRTRILLAVQTVLTLAAVISWWTLFRRSLKAENPWQVAEAPIPPLWSGRVAAVVVLRGVVVGGLAMVATLTAFDNFSDTLQSLILYFPLMFLIYKHLLRPFSSEFGTTFGLRLLPRAAFRCLQIAIILVVVQVLIDTLIANLPESWGSTSHWNEWFDWAFAWGNRWQIADSFAGAIVIAPIFEETIFRGILYASLRRRFTFWTAGAMSSVAFALIHGYGFAGFLSTVSCGLLWAWAYERSRSLLPGMISHALSNLLVCLGVLVLLR